VDIRNLLAELLERPVPISAHSESAAAYNCVVGYREPAELLSKPDAVLVRQALLQGTVAKVCRVDSSDNPAHALSDDPAWAIVRDATHQQKSAHPSLVNSQKVKSMSAGGPTGRRFRYALSNDTVSTQSCGSQEYIC